MFLDREETMIFEKLDLSIKSMLSISTDSENSSSFNQLKRRSYEDGFIKSRYNSAFLLRKSIIYVSDDQFSNLTNHTDSGISSIDSNDAQQFIIYSELRDYLQNTAFAYEDLELKYSYVLNVNFHFDKAGNTIFHLVAKYAKPDFLK